MHEVRVYSDNLFLLSALVLYAAKNKKAWVLFDVLSEAGSDLIIFAEY